MASFIPLEISPFIASASLYNASMQISIFVPEFLAVVFNIGRQTKGNKN